MNKSNYEQKIDDSWARLQDCISKAEVAYNRTVQTLIALGEKGVTKVWIGVAGPEHSVTSHSLYTHKDHGGYDIDQHDILSRVGVNAGCSNGNGKQMQTQIKMDSLVYGIYELNENGWVRVE